MQLGSKINVINVISMCVQFITGNSINTSAQIQITEYILTDE